MRIDRLLAITFLLLNRDKVTARELAERFEVSVRTIYRDIDAMILAGIPIVPWQGNDGGYSLYEKYKISNRFFTSNDFISIISSLKTLNTTLEDKYITDTLEKIIGLIPNENGKDIFLKSDQIVIDIHPWGYGRRQKDKLADIQNALRDSRVIKFSYLNTASESCVRAVEPMTLVFKGYGWYLYGYCLLKNDFRFFRLSRISDLKIEEKHFIPKDVKYKEYEQHSDNVDSYTKIQLKFSPDVKVRVFDLFDKEEIQQTTDGYFFVTVMYPLDEWVYSMFLGFGEYLEVLDPPHIKAILKEKAKKIFDKY